MLKKVSQFILVSSFCIAQSQLLAEPAPFGIKINKTTVSDLSKMYSIKKNPIGKYLGGEVYDINIAELNFRGLSSATVNFNEQGRAVGVLLSAMKDRYDNLFNLLLNKYDLVYDVSHCAGDKHAKFKDNSVLIFLDAPRAKSDITLNYLDKDFDNLIQQSIKQRKKRKEESETSQL